MSNKRQYYNNRQQSSSPAATSNTGVSTGNGSIPQLVPFVKENGIGPLIQDYNIQVKYHKIYKNLLLFKYDQISSPWEVAVVRECRAIILDRDNDWKVVSYPYNKFFNYGEKWADPIDWSSAAVYEKLDGSLAVLYYYNDEWFVSSSGMPDASGTLTASQIRFCDLFWSIWKKMRYHMPKDTSKCYMFEMVTPTHTIVVQPKEEFIALHGCRDLTTMKELDPETVAKENGWRVVNRLPLTNIEEIVAAAGKLNPIQAEGFVICDKDFHRIKVKSPQYVALAHLSIKDKRKLNHRHMLEIIRHNEGDEFLAYFPQWSRLYKHVKQFYEYIAKTLDEIFVTVKSSLRRTAHALEENKNEYAVVSAKDIMDDSFKEKLQKKLIAEDMKQEKDHAMKILLKIYNANPTPSLKEYMSTCDIDEIMPLFDVWKQKNKFHDETESHADESNKSNNNNTSKAREESKKDVEKMAFEELDGKLSKRQHDILANKLKKGELDMNDLQKTNKGARNTNNTNAGKKNNKEEDIDKIIKEIAEYDMKQANKPNNNTASNDNSSGNNTKVRNRKQQPKRRK